MMTHAIIARRLVSLTWEPYFGPLRHYSWGYYTHYTVYGLGFIAFLAVVHVSILRH
jgi:hypothetical protein